MNLPSLVVKHPIFAVAPRQILPNAVDRLRRLRVGGSEIRRRALQPVLPVINAASQLMDNHRPSDEIDEWKKQVPVETVFVQLAWMEVRCCANNGAKPIEVFEQAPDDHCVRDVLDLHFIQADHTDIFGKLLRHRGNRIVDLRLTNVVQGRMDLLHEVEKVHPSLALCSREFKEQVHEHRLAATDLAPNVESFLGALLALSKNAPE